MLWLGGRGRVGLGVGVGVVGPAGVVEKIGVEEGCALIGLGAEIWDIPRGCGMSHWDVTKVFWLRIGGFGG